MFMRVSARLQASAAPDAPAPMISTSAVVSGMRWLSSALGCSRPRAIYDVRDAAGNTRSTADRHETCSSTDR